MENGPFIGDVPIKTSIHREFSVAMFDYQRINITISVSLVQLRSLLVLAVLLVAHFGAACFGHVLQRGTGLGEHIPSMLLNGQWCGPLWAFI